MKNTLSKTTWEMEFFSRSNWRDVINFLKEERIEDIRPKLRHIDACIKYHTTCCTYAELGKTYGVSLQRARQLSEYGGRVIRGEYKYLLMDTRRWERYQQFRKLCTLSGFEDYAIFLELYNPIRLKMDKCIIQLDDILYLDILDIQELYDDKANLVDAFMIIQSVLSALMNQPISDWKYSLL